MAVRFCTTHGIGYNPRLDPVCPQCSLSRMAPAPVLKVDENPGSPGFGFPIPDGAVEGDRSLQRII